MKQDEYNLLETDIDGKPFPSRLAAIKYTLAYYRVSQECIDFVFRHYSDDEIGCAIEAMGSPTEHSEPDTILLDWLNVITHRRHYMPAYIPNDPHKHVIKTDKETAARNIAKVKAMLHTAGICVSRR